MINISDNSSNEGDIQALFGFNEFRKMTWQAQNNSSLPTFLFEEFVF